jgi:hypothetical protein
MPLWHEAWPNKDLSRMRVLLPELKQRSAELVKVTLPEIEHDKQARWNQGVQAIAAAATALDQAVQDQQTQPALDAAERLHGEFEGLMRLLRPAPKAVEDYHQVLYRIYHDAWPSRRLDDLAKHSALLVTRCAALRGAVWPARYAARQETLGAQVAKLCAATETLAQLSAASTDPGQLGKAVDDVHLQYRTLAQAFE